MNYAVKIRYGSMCEDVTILGNNNKNDRMINLEQLVGN
jgi:hypothetical protein